MKAREGSTHGYDIADYTKINSESHGGEKGSERLEPGSARRIEHRFDPRFRALTMSACISPTICKGSDVLEWGPPTAYAAIAWISTGTFLAVPWPRAGGNC